MRAQYSISLLMVLFLVFSTFNGQIAIAREIKVQRQSALDQMTGQITLDPTHNSLTGQLQLHLGVPAQEIEIKLHSGLTLFYQQDYNFSKVEPGEFDPATNYSIYKLTSTSGSLKTFNIEYHGIINQPIEDNFSHGIISQEGVALFESSYWHPVTGQDFNYEISIHSPIGWTPLLPGSSQQLGPQVWQFQSSQPMPSLALIANQFQTYSEFVPNGPKVNVFLREADSHLAATLLATVKSAIINYSKEISTFPAGEFTVVENFFETGFAFPGFTLLGPSVIRFPFILTSSLPHEVLHSWWGNGVYVDYEKGNWCEGLTTYMADHRYKVLEGKGSIYRRKALQNYFDFVKNEGDFALRDFVARHDEGSQALGYGKSMMLFQMLENLIGSDKFKTGLTSFYNEYKFKPAGFIELQNSFSKHVGENLDSFFNPWLDQTGATKIEVKDMELQENPTGKFILKFEVTQKPDDPEKYQFMLPIEIHFKNKIERQLLKMTDTIQNFETQLTERPLAVKIDPNYEVFRHLYPEEQATTFSKAFGSSDPVYVSVPASEKDTGIWDEWINEIGKLHKRNVNTVTDTDEIPDDGPLWILGKNNLHSLPLSEMLIEKDLEISAFAINSNGKKWNQSDVVSFQTEKIKDQPQIWVWTEASNSASIHMSKMKHYSSFSWALFEKTKNQIKIEWEPSSSPLNFKF
jgi:aminopeptidase N